MKTPAFETFIAPARAYPQIWRLVLGAILIVFINFVFLVTVFLTIYLFGGIEALENANRQLEIADQPTVVMLMLFWFSFVAFSTAATARLLHRRKAKTLLGPFQPLFLGFLKATSVSFAIIGISTLLWAQFYDAVPNIEIAIWLTFLPLALVGLLIQTGAEELLFRGYLVQQLGARFRSPLIWMVLPSIIFGLLHYNPKLPLDALILVFVSATTFGLIATDLVRITGNLGAAWGIHFANNSFALLFLTLPDGIPGLALFLTPYSTAQASQNLWLISANIITLIIVWQILRRILRA